MDNSVCTWVAKLSHSYSFPYCNSVANMKSYTVKQENLAEINFHYSIMVLFYFVTKVKLFRGF